MTSLDEFITQTNADKAHVNDASASIDRSKSLAEELQSRFELLAADTMSAGTQQLRSLVEEAQALLAPVVSRLDDAMVHAQALKT